MLNLSNIIEYNYKKRFEHSMKSRITIKDIAKKTGFSITTISLSLNNKAPHIPLETRNFIAKTAKEMGYRPNKMAVGLVKQKSNIIGFILPDIRNQFFSHIAKVLEDECNKIGWNLLICNTNNKHEQELRHLKMLDDYMVDGIFLTIAGDSTEEEEQKTIDFLQKSKIPYCLIDRDMFNIGKYKIGVNHFHGAYLATQHLIELGHKKIGHITGPLVLQGARQRLNGYKQAMSDYNLPVDEDWIYIGDYSFDKGKSGGKYLAGKKVSAIFAANDFSAIGALAGIKECNLFVPEDISLVGYDDIEFASFLEAPLTTIRQPIDTIGKKAIQILREIVENDNLSEKIEILEPTLIIRKSSRRLN